MPKSCSVGLCKHHHLMRNENNEQMYGFFKFPSAKTEFSRRMLWANACKRVDLNTNSAWKPADNVTYVYVCSDHFVTGKPVNVSSHPDFVPNKNLGKAESLSGQPEPASPSNLDRSKRVWRRQQEKATPKRKKITLEALPLKDAANTLCESVELPLADLLKEEKPELEESNVDLLSESPSHVGTSVVEPPSPVPTGSTNVERAMPSPLKEEQLVMEMNFLRQERDSFRIECEELQKRLNNTRLSAKCVEGDDRKCRYYTGLPWDVFSATYQHLVSCAVNKGIPKIPYIDQFFLTLVKLKHAPKFEYLAHQAGLCHPSTMIDYFWKWVELIVVCLGMLVAWPSRDYIYKTTPPHIKEKYPRLTAIIDCSEFFIETPGQVKAHAQCYSNYKKHTTVKFLIACNPLGCVTYLSPAYGGRISDVNLVRDCGFMTPSLHHHGDQILADRGFTMTDEFAGYLGVELIVPAFLKNRLQFPDVEVQGSRKMSSVRIHIERVIGLLKNRFSVLQGVLPIRFIKSIKDEVEEVDMTSVDKLVRCCAILANLTTSIVYNK